MRERPTQEHTPCIIAAHYHALSGMSVCASCTAIVQSPGEINCRTERLRFDACGCVGLPRQTAAQP